MAPKILISAGTTREYIDDLRFLSNGATGKMGIAIAEAARDRGMEVHLAIGPTTEDLPSGVEIHPFVSAIDLDRIAEELWPEINAFVATAAVADYRPKERIEGKFKKSEGDWNLCFVRNPDVLANRGKEKGDRVMVGFALESKPTLEAARAKLIAKNLDLVVLNPTQNIGVSGGQFHFVQAVESESFGQITKVALAENILNFVEPRLPE